MSVESTVQQAHCRRTAALALEVGRRAGVPLGPLEQAALLHHSLDSFHNSSGIGRLAWHVVAGEDGRRIADIVQICNMIDEQLEMLEFEHREIDAILAEIREFAAFEGFDPQLLDPICALRCYAGTFTPSLPVEARLAGHVVGALREDRDYEPEALESLARRDPALAASLLRVANSALYGRMQRINTVGRAVASIGVLASRKIMLATAMRPVFASTGLSAIWSHSLCAAPLCSALASRSALIPPDEAFLLGVLHDVGAIATQFLPAETLSAFRRLIEGGCPPAYVERLLLGADHGEIGARYLAAWDFPPDFVEAVRYHHQPERSHSPRASLLFLAEFWSGLDEDIASFGRVENSLQRAGVALDTLIEAGREDPAFRALKTVA